MRSYRLPERYILSVGTIEERKNALAIVKALEYLPDELHFVLVGRPTAYIHQLKEFMTKAGLQDRVHFLHGIPSDDLPAIISRPRLLYTHPFTKVLASLFLRLCIPAFRW